jgi:hypothetical protein
MELLIILLYGNAIKIILRKLPDLIFHDFTILEQIAKGKENRGDCCGAVFAPEPLRLTSSREYVCRSLMG